MRLKISMNRAKWFVTTADHNPDVYRLDSNYVLERFSPKKVQPSLFDTSVSRVSVISGEI